jgi:hypothetical protein
MLIPSLAVALLWPAAGAAEKSVSVETVAYKDWKNNLRLSMAPPNS